MNPSDVTAEPAGEQPEPQVQRAVDGEQPEAQAQRAANGSGAAPRDKEPADSSASAPDSEGGATVDEDIELSTSSENPPA